MKPLHARYLSEDEHKGDVVKIVQILMVNHVLTAICVLKDGSFMATKPALLQVITPTFDEGEFKEFEEFTKGA